MMAVGIQIIVYVYGTICLSLVAYSILYILKQKSVDKINAKRIVFWEEAITEQCSALVNGHKISEKHKSLLCKRLKHLNQLLAFQKAFQKIQEEKLSNELSNYVFEMTSVFSFLGMEYSKKDSMEKAYFAHVISICWYCNTKEYHMLMDTLVSYLIGSTVYCRENVLQALYRIGNIQAIENAFRILNDYQYFHHAKLLTDGLITFSGDKQLLARSLWKYHKEWNHEIVIALIQFITRCDESFKEIFWEMINDLEVHIEIRLAIIRYYKKHYFIDAGKLLRQYVEESDEKNTTIGIVAASALENYPGEDTMLVLKKALCHRDWYIRHNAAATLVHLGITHEEINEIVEGSDHYASEMLDYMVRATGSYSKERGKEVS